MRAALAGDGDVLPAVAVEVGHADLETGAGAAVGQHVLGEAALGGVPLVEGDAARLVVARIVAAVGAHAAAGDEVRLAVAVEVFPDQAMVLRDLVVDHEVAPVGAPVLIRVALLLPVEAVVVAVAADDVGAAVAGEVDDDHRGAGVRPGPVGVAAPRAGGDVPGGALVPAVAVEDVLAAVAVEVPEADPVAVHERGAGLDHPRSEDGLARRALREPVRHQRVGVAVGVDHVLGHAVAVEIAQGGPLVLHQLGLDQHVLAPRGGTGEPGRAGVLVPVHLRVHKGARDDVRVAVTVHVVGVLAAVGDVVLPEGLELAELALGGEGGPLVPVLAGADIGASVAVEVGDGAALVVIHVELLHADLEERAGGAALLGRGGGQRQREGEEGEQGWGAHRR